MFLTRQRENVGTDCEALNARLGGSNWVSFPLSQTAGKGPWSEGSACGPFEAKPGYRHPAGARAHSLRTPQSSTPAGAGVVGKGRLFAIQISDRWEDFLGGGEGHGWSQLPHFSPTP